MQRLWPAAPSGKQRLPDCRVAREVTKRASFVECGNGHVCLRAEPVSSGRGHSIARPVKPRRLRLQPHGITAMNGHAPAAAERIRHRRSGSFAAAVPPAASMRFAAQRDSRSARQSGRPAAGSGPVGSFPAAPHPGETLHRNQPFNGPLR